MIPPKTTHPEPLQRKIRDEIKEHLGRIGALGSIS